MVDGKKEAPGVRRFWLDGLRTSLYLDAQVTLQKTHTSGASTASVEATIQTV